jgi:hypothetical protein
MAKATKVNKTEYVYVPAKYENKPVQTFTLELTKDEARTILDLTAFIGGASDTTRRGLTDTIGKALRDAGVEGTSFEVRSDEISGAVSFHSPEMIAANKKKRVGSDLFKAYKAFKPDSLISFPDKVDPYKSNYGAIKGYPYQ